MCGVHDGVGMGDNVGWKLIKMGLSGPTEIDGGEAFFIHNHNFI